MKYLEKYRENMQAKPFAEVKRLVDSQSLFIEGQLLSGIYDSVDIFDREHGHLATLAVAAQVASNKAKQGGEKFNYPSLLREYGYNDGA